MSNMARILSISDDEGFRLSREVLLRNAGYETESVTSHEFLKLSYVRTFDIAVICSSVETKRVGPLVDLLTRYNPDIQILDTEDLQTGAEIRFQMSFPLSSGPDRLLKTVKEMCNKACASG